MSRCALWTAVCWIVLISPLANVLSHFHDPHYQSWNRYRPILPPPPPRRPVEVMTDVVNHLGTRVLQQYVNSGNVAFSPAGLGFILSALYEGTSGRSYQQIVDCLGLPRDRSIVRVGMRDIHRRLRTYLNPDGFLGGLNLNRENTTLRAEYEKILRFYGFDLTIDLSNFTENNTNLGNFGLKSSMTTSTASPTVQTQDQTQPGSVGTTSGNMDTATTVPPPTGAATNSQSVTIGGTTAAVGGGTIIDTSLSIIAATTTPPTMGQTTPIGTTAATAETPASTTPSRVLQGAASATATTIQPVAMMMSTTTQGSTVTPPQQTTFLPTDATTAINMNGALISTTLPRVPAMSQAIPVTVTNTMQTTTEIPITSTMPATIAGITEATLITDDIATVAVPTAIPAMLRSRRGRSRRSSEGYFLNYPDDGPWMQNLDIYAERAELPANVRDATEMQFLVNRCEPVNVPAATYTAVLPFAYFPSLKAVAVEFPLDNPKYNLLLFLPTERLDTDRLARGLTGQNLRLLRKQLQPTWTRATIPSFMLRGFVTLTPYVQRLGIGDVFEPRLAELGPMSPDLGVYARDVQQSIAVNIESQARPEATAAGAEDEVAATAAPPTTTTPAQPVGGNEGAAQRRRPQEPSQRQRSFQSARDRDSRRFTLPANELLDRIGLITFTAEHPFLYFIVDDETSVSLIAGRIDDPLNSRIL